MCAGWELHICNGDELLSWRTNTIILRPRRSVKEVFIKLIDVFHKPIDVYDKFNDVLHEAKVLRHFNE